MQFEHHQTAHCESGVTSNLLTNNGHPLSEPLAFGIGSGLFFVYLPFVKIMGIPLTSFRSFPGTIFKKTCKRLEIPYQYNKYKDPINGAKVLDSFATAQKPVGLQTNIFWLPYIPEAFRFQFNGHNLVVFDKKDNQYHVSDPILEETTLCPSSAMTRARYSQGPLSPKGLIYYPLSKEKFTDEQLAIAIRKGIRETTHRMLYIPFPFFGIKGIRFLARSIPKWPKKLQSEEKVRLYLANVVRMQEEIGTGGAGFRYLYAAFLQESGVLTGSTLLKEASLRMTEVGNMWREFATLSAKYCKGRSDSLEDISKKLLQAAHSEEQIFRTIKEKYIGKKRFF